MPNEIKKICKQHGETEYVLEGRGYWRCKKCRSERVTKYRKKRKTDLVEAFGGKCQICGYDKCQEALQFHHIDPSQKQYGIAQKGHCRKWDEVVLEAGKCILVCANCHVEIESGTAQIPG